MRRKLRESKQLKEVSITVQDLKIKIEAIKKTEGNLEIENLGKRTETKNVSITNRIQEMEERPSDIEVTVEETGTPVKQNVKSKKFLI